MQNVPQSWSTYDSDPEPISLEDIVSYRDICVQCRARTYSYRTCLRRCVIEETGRGKKELVEGLLLSGFCGMLIHSFCSNVRFSCSYSHATAFNNVLTCFSRRVGLVSAAPKRDIKGKGLKIRSCLQRRLLHSLEVCFPITFTQIYSTALHEKEHSK